jgi:bis(5'-nucleosyl)-tetraphosphatase (symmetrical)
MALYLIGDIQGCDSALQRLLDEISFSPSRDTLYFLGDLVNRGPDSLGVLRRLMAYGASAKTVLGNHDLHLLALAEGVRKPHRKDTLQDILEAPDKSALLLWLKNQRMAILERIQGHEVLMVHAGVLPSWTGAKTIELACEVEDLLKSASLGHFLNEMYSDEPTGWSDSLTGNARLRVIVNALTRMRFCDSEGQMEFAAKEGVTSAPPGFMPWFDVPGRQTAPITVAFGHWSTLGWINRPKVLSLDTGCVWGGCLSALRLGGLDDVIYSAKTSSAPALKQELIQVKCAQAQKPG